MSCTPWKRPTAASWPRSATTTRPIATKHCKPNRRTEAAPGASLALPECGGIRPHLLRLRDDRLLMSVGHRRAPLGNQAALSNDHGRNWLAPLVISGDGAGGDLGYPSSVELADGALLTAWYEQLAGKPAAVLRLARWKASMWP